jgi:hypothetical protein
VTKAIQGVESGGQGDDEFSEEGQDERSASDGRGNGSRAKGSDGIPNGTNVQAYVVLNSCKTKNMLGILSFDDRRNQGLFPFSLSSN